MLSRAFVACLICWSTFLASNDLPDGASHKHGTHRPKSAGMYVAAEISEAPQDLRWVHEEGCSRMSSRLVRSFLVKDVFPRLPFAPSFLPDTCQLNPKLDRYRWQEGNKTEITRGDFQCSLCAKHFRTEFYLDKHMHNMHAAALEGGDGAVCLGDLCPIFGCSNHHDAIDQMQYRAGRAVSGISRWAPDRASASASGEKVFKLDETCTPAILERQQYQCDALMRKCFNGIEDLALQKQFKKNICGELECIHGILKGSIVQRGLDAFKLGTEYMRGDSLEKSAYWSDTDDDETSTNAAAKPKGSMLFHIFRMLLVAGVLCFVIGYSYFTGVEFPVLSLKFWGRGRGARGKTEAMQPSRGRFAKPVGASSDASGAGAKELRPPATRDSPPAPQPRNRYYANSQRDHDI